MQCGKAGREGGWEGVRTTDSTFSLTFWNTLLFHHVSEATVMISQILSVVISGNFVEILLIYHQNYKTEASIYVQL